MSAAWQLNRLAASIEEMRAELSELRAGFRVEPRRRRVRAKTLARQRARMRDDKTSLQTGDERHTKRETRRLELASVTKRDWQEAYWEDLRMGMWRYFD